MMKEPLRGCVAHAWPDPMAHAVGDRAFAAPRLTDRNDMRREDSPSCGAAIRVKPRARLCEGINLLDASSCFESAERTPA